MTREEFAQAIREALREEAGRGPARAEVGGRHRWS